MEVDAADLRIRDNLRQEALRRYWEQVAHRQTEDKRQRDDRMEAEGDLLEAAVTALATAEQIKVFEVKLDRYDEATVKALQENERQLDIVNEKIEELLGQAYVLQDGRRVFKTKDGQRVFDEHGAELSAEEIDPGLIEDHRPQWETFSEQKMQQRMLMQERGELLDYQERLDKTRERLDDEDLTAKELDDLDKDLMEDMPLAVKRQLDGGQPEGTTLHVDALSISETEYVNTVGAGDAFLGGFLLAAAGGCPVNECLTRGVTSAAAILTVEAGRLPYDSIHDR